MALVLTLAVLAGAAPARARAATRHVPSGFVGMDVDGSLWPTTEPGINLAAQLNQMVRSGVESLRVTFNWAGVQPFASWAQLRAEAPEFAKAFTNVGGVPTAWRSLDKIVGLAAKRRLKILPVILNAPGWDALPMQGPMSVSMPARDGPYANFAKALVRRYGPHGRFWSVHKKIPKVPIRMWQIWNEPNTSTFWTQPFAQGYVALLGAAHDAIKAADPHAKIVLAGLPNYSWTALEQIYAIPGARNLFDVVDVHPYTKVPGGVILILAKDRQTMAAHGDPHKAMIAGEISWPSAEGQNAYNPSNFDFITTEAGQASNVRAIVPMLAQHRRALGLTGFYYYNWASAEPPGGFAFDFSGLFRYASDKLVAKPAFAAFRGAALAVEGCHKKGTIATRCLKR